MTCGDNLNDLPSQLRAEVAPDVQSSSGRTERTFVIWVLSSPVLSIPTVRHEHKLYK